MDNQETGSNNAPLDVNTAATAFATLFDTPAETGDEEVKKPEAEAKAEAEPEEVKPEAVTESKEAEPTFTIKVDGKEVEVPLSELKNGYQRQADYTRKTMEVAEQRKTAEAETVKAKAERDQYAQGLQQQALLLHASLQEQNKIDWQALLASDPVEYLKQQHLAQTRQAQLQQTQAERQRVAALQQAEADTARNTFVAKQQDELLAKLPDWKDATKAKVEKEALANFLLDSGFSKDEVAGVVDHRSVLLARDAMLYRQMVEKAKAAAKKVESLPQKVEKPGHGETQSLDKRSAAFQRLSKTGRVEDAAGLFAQFL